MGVLGNLEAILSTGTSLSSLSSIYSWSWASKRIKEIVGGSDRNDSIHNSDEESDKFSGDWFLPSYSTSYCDAYPWYSRSWAANSSHTCLHSHSTRSESTYAFIGKFQKYLLFANEIYALTFPIFAVIEYGPRCSSVRFTGCVFQGIFTLIDPGQCLLLLVARTRTRGCESSSRSEIPSRAINRLEE